MSETRTHEATGQRLAHARERGDIATSPDLATAAVLAGACAWGAFFAAPLWIEFQHFARESLSGRPLAAAHARQLASMLGWALVILPSAALLATLAQRGFGVGVTRSDASSLGQRLGRGVNADALFGLLASAIKLVVLGAVLAFALSGSLPGLVDAFHREPAQIVTLSGSLAANLAWRSVLALSVLGAGDLLYLRWRRARRLRMTHHELVRERRETEGDPRLLHERRARGRALLFQASLAELDAAALVLVASDRALALRYDPARDPAPRLWLKARAAEAERLVARAHVLTLPVHDDESLVSELFRMELSQTIPTHLHARVAALLVGRA